jgi:hypothetical protein
MPQTVYMAGNPITSRIRLGVTPDGTTTVALTVFRPDGTTLDPSPALSPAWENGERTAQWFATNDGFQGSAVDAADGDWLAVWRVTGTGSTVASKVYSVAPLPGTGTRPAWSPFLSEVADHVPFLTIDSTTPGSQLYLGTFTGATTPTDEQAQRHVDRAVATVSARVGTIPVALYPLARGVAAARAAAAILRAFPRTRDDRDAAAELDRRADADFVQLVDGAESAGTAASAGPLPVAYFPAPNTWGDLDL